MLLGIARALTKIILELLVHQGKLLFKLKARV